MRKQLNLISLVICVFPCFQVGALTPSEYIRKYKDCAIEQMLIYNIPASITLAQGMLESQCGSSPLAVNANNHFGIKCHDDWNGPYYVYDDDARGEHFRKYQSVNDSYKDHVAFLRSRPWYTFLFNFARTDYRDWATGLAKAGYATASDYSQQLIFIIEQNHLFAYDTVLQKLKGFSILYETPEEKEKITEYAVSDYVIIKPGDCIYKIARQYNLDVNTLCRNNGLSINHKLIPGQRLYLKGKYGRTASNQNKNPLHDKKELSVLPGETTTPKG